MGLFALGQMVVKIEQVPGNIPDGLNLVQDITGMLFFLDLLFDEPLEHLEGRVVLFLHGKVDEPVDHAGHFLFVGIRILKHLSC